MIEEPKPDEGLREEIGEELSQFSSGLLAWKSWGTVALDKVHELKEMSINQILLNVASHYQVLEEHCSELVDDVIRLEMEKKQLQAKIEDEFVKAFAEDYHKTHDKLHILEVEEAKREEKKRLITMVENWVKRYGGVYTIPRDKFYAFIQSIKEEE